MRKLFFILFLFTFTISLKGQDWGSYWCFGDSAGIDFSNPQLPTPIVSHMDNAWSCSTIGDSANGLLLYAHSLYLPIWLQGSYYTTAILNKNHEVIINGDSLIGRSHDALVFINKPGSQNLFYLLQSDFNPINGFYYSLVDPHFAQDSGIILKKNVRLNLTDNHVQRGIIATRHGNGRDWWVICRNWDNSNRWNLFLFTPDSIIGPIEENVGTITHTEISGLAVSKEGDKIALVNYSGLAELYDFDRCSGLISNPVKIIFSCPSTSFLGCEFSSNGNLFYLSLSDNLFGDSLRLFQFDITNSNPGSTVQKIYCENVPASGGFLKRGPDDKIYFSCLYINGWPYDDSARTVYNENLSVINNPDVYGLGCNFTPFSFYLGGKRTYWGLPNNPNFNLGALTGSACDYLVMGINSTSKIGYLFLYPNPASDNIYITNNSSKEGIYTIYNSLSAKVKEGKLKSGNNRISTSGLRDGYYIILFEESLYKKFSIIH